MKAKFINRSTIFRRKLVKSLYLLIPLMGFLSCQQEDVNSDVPVQLSREIQQTKNYFELNYTSAKNKFISTDKLDLVWNNAYVTAPISQVSINKTVSTAKTANKVDAYSTELSLDKWGFVELFPSNTENSVIKIPATYKMKNGNTFSKRLFLYLVKDKDSKYSTFLVNYSINNSVNSVMYSGNVIVTSFGDQGIHTVKIVISENKVVGLNELAVKKPASMNKTSKLTATSDLADDVIIGEMNCPDGLLFNSSTTVCDWPEAGGTCSSYVVTESGNTYSACEVTVVGSDLPPNSTGVTGSYPFYKLYISYEVLISVSAGSFSIVAISGMVPEPFLTKIGAGGFTLAGIISGWTAGMCPTGVKFGIATFGTLVIVYPLGCQ